MTIVEHPLITLNQDTYAAGLKPDEVELMQRVQRGLSITADLSRADICLVVGTDDGLRVVAQAMPHSIASLYRQSWVDWILPYDDNPLLTAALGQGRNGQVQVNLMDRGTPVVLQVMPVVSAAGRVIAAVKVETNLIAWERQKRRDDIFQKAVVWLQQMTFRGDLASADHLTPFSEWDGVVFVDEAFKIRYVSGIANNLYRRLGYLDSLDGKHIGDLQTKDVNLIDEAFRTSKCQEHQVIEGGLYWTRKVVPVWSYGSTWWPFAKGNAGKLIQRGALVMVHDETVERDKARQLQVLSTMIKEVHHRVKNNLQTVASILRMQGRRTDDPEVRLQLTEAVNRILAVSVIHEFLSREDDQMINVRDVCQRIVTQTQRAVVAPGKLISLNVAGPPIYLPSQQATACALVANELVLNALEHAFHGRERGSVSVQLTDLGDQMALVVLDDGVGLPESTGSVDDSLGLTIVRTLVEGDLKGEFTMERASPGTRASVTFMKDVPNRA
ncbi:MAG: histidine kinase N-terminal domain-containing protein [Anaerolineae bacterium]|nr:histidine kinase N-terminal domain-containing protein [Anaerolineae bacterium]